MKRQLALAALTALLFLAAGCGNQTAGQPAAAAGSVAASSSQAAESPSAGTAADARVWIPQPLETAKLENDALAAPAEAEILAAYAHAAAAYGWFALRPLPCSGGPVSLDGTTYYRVDYAGIETMDDLQTYLRGLFSEDLVQSLLTQTPPPYRENEGRLCAMPFDHSGELRQGNASLSVERISGTRYLVDVAQEMLGEDRKSVAGMEYDAFPYEYLNGQWVFTAFHLVD